MMAAATTSSQMTLQQLLAADAPVSGCAHLPVTGITCDSREVQPGYAFIAYELPGQSNIAYINAAVNAGAVAVIVEATALPENYLCNAPLLRVERLHEKAGRIASRFYAEPSANMVVTGVTGTNGKSSVSHLLARSLTECTSGGTGLIGTLGYGRLPDLRPGPNTTPAAVTLQSMLAAMRDAKVAQVVLEVSSHGIDQHRIDGVQFDQALFTNLSRDHLDYHGTMENYAATKRRFFTDYAVRQAIINLDDAFGRELPGSLPEATRITGYTLDEKHYAGFSPAMSVVYGQVVAQHIGGMQINIHSTYGDGKLKSRLFGRHNASNLLAALAALCQRDIELQQGIEALEKCGAIPGRMECFMTADRPAFIVDYAHTPDALQHVLQSLKPLCRGRLFCVFGCGGDRDKGKREEMGRVAAAIADQIILTNDNPRHEDPDAIIAAIQKGVGSHAAVSVIKDRQRAIQQALQDAVDTDLVLVAGKGHESCQDIQGRKTPFSDQQVICELLEGAT